MEWADLEPKNEKPKVLTITATSGASVIVLQ